MNNLKSRKKEKIVKYDILNKTKVFAIKAIFKNTNTFIISENMWREVYFNSSWFDNIYRIHIFDIFDFFITKKHTIISLFYRINQIIDILWKHYKNIYLPCISKFLMITILKLVHDNTECWIKTKMMIKFRNYIYWFQQSENIEKYIERYLNCAKYKPVIKFQFFHFVIVLELFKLFGINFINSLSISKNGYRFIFHIICYFSRFFVMFFNFIVNVFNIISTLQ